MIIADKILNLRKKHGLSQEELAEKLSVSRQSVSKWESAASIPDITKIMAIASLFSVSTDYLLKDEMELPEYEGQVEKTTEHLITIEEANTFIGVSKAYGKKIALGVLLCIISPIVLIFLSSLSDGEVKWLSFSSGIAVAIGLVFLFAIIALAVTIFITSDAVIKPFEYLKRGDFELSFGVFGIIKEKQNAFMPIRTKNLTISILMFILGALPLIISSLLQTSEIVLIAMLILLITVVALGVFNLITYETQKGAYDILLREGEFDRKSMKSYKMQERIGGIYWPIIIAIYLGWSFATNDWGFTWIVWPIAALLFSAISAIFSKQ